MRFHWSPAAGRVGALVMILAALGGGAWWVSTADQRSPRSPDAPLVEVAGVTVRQADLDAALRSAAGSIGAQARSQAQAQVESGMLSRLIEEARLDAHLAAKNTPVTPADERRARALIAARNTARTPPPADAVARTARHMALARLLAPNYTPTDDQIDVRMRTLRAEASRDRGPNAAGPAASPTAQTTPSDTALPSRKEVEWMLISERIRPRVDQLMVDLRVRYPTQRRDASVSLDD